MATPSLKAGLVILRAPALCGCSRVAAAFGLNKAQRWSARVRPARLSKERQLVCRRTAIPLSWAVLTTMAAQAQHGFSRGAGAFGLKSANSWAQVQSYRLRQA